jgi:hypothetical protein
MNARSWLVIGVVCLAVGAAVVAGLTRAQAPAAGPAAQLRQLAYLKASNAGMSDHFGCGGSLPGHIGNALAISGDGNTVAVGAPHESSASRGINGNEGDDSLHASGAVYVFVRQGQAWTQQAYIKASNPGQSDNFGSNVALSADGSTLAVSAFWEASAATGVNGNQDDNSMPQAGAVYVFTRAGGTWTQQAYVKASNTGRGGEGDELGDGDQFGFSLALSGDGNTLAVGAVSEDSNATGIDGNQSDDSASSAGAVYLYTRTGAAWAQGPYLKGSNTEGGDLFGYGVALNDDGSALAVAAYDEDGSGKSVNPVQDNELTGTGAIYAFSRAGGTWRETAYMKGSRNQRNDALGYTIAMSGDGDTIAAGTAEESCLVGGINPSGCDTDTFPEELAAGSAGAAYVWVRNGDAWSEQAFIKASNPDLEDWFAVRLALSSDGHTLLVGAPMEDSSARGLDGPDNDDAQDAGAAYLYTRSGATWSQQAYIKGANTEAFDEFGSSVAVSGDGSTMVIGARAESGGSGGINGNPDSNDAPEAGAVYLFGRN